MKKFNYLMLFLTLIALLATSCSKDGATGPQGTTGATGPQGPIGPAGPAGANGQNGSVIYSGNTVPASTTGAIGDFYINLTTGLLYGPKTATGWGTGFSLKGATGSAGATGATGAAGNKIYSGSGAPATTIGVAGDYYLDKTNYMLYGPKTASSWGTPLSLQGPAGPQGPVGPQGPEGNANVLTDVFSVTNSQWLWNSQYVFQTNPSSYTEYFTRYYVRSNNSITQDVLTNGMVLVYFTPNTSNNTNQWAPLPYQFTDGSGNFNYNIAYETSVGAVTLHYFFVQTNAAATIPVLSTYTIATYSFKIISVTGKAGIFMLEHHINLNDYKEVSKVTGLWQQDKLRQ
jgi:hypothetical protein